MWAELGLFWFPAKDKVKTKQQIALWPFLLLYGDREEPESLLWAKSTFDWETCASSSTLNSGLSDMVNTSTYRQWMLPALLLQRTPARSSNSMKKTDFSKIQSPLFSFSFFLLSLCIRAQWCLLNSRCFLQSGTSKTPAWFDRSFSAWRGVVKEISSQLEQMGDLGTNVSKCSPKAAQGLPFPMWAPVSTL